MSLTKFFTDKQKRVRPISNRRHSVGTYQTGTAHLSVPKKIQVKQKTIIRVFYEHLLLSLGIHNLGG